MPASSSVYVPANDNTACRKLIAALAPHARGALVFPNVTKAGFIVGALYGNGALVKAKQEGGYYIR